MKEILITSELTEREIKQYILKYGEFIIRIQPIENYNQKVISKLQHQYESLAIIGIKWNGTIIISKGINTEEIIKHKNSFLQLFQEYSNKGVQLLKELYKINNIDVNTKSCERDLIFKLKKVNKYPSNKLNNQWFYRFHGGDIEFRNVLDDRSIEVNFQDKWKLNSWSIKNYLYYSLEFDRLKILVNNHEKNIRKAMDILFNIGELEEAEDLINNELKLKKPNR